MGSWPSVNFKKAVMKTMNNISKQKAAFVTIDRSLDKLDDKILFPEKLEKANKMLSKAKLPDRRHRD